MSSSVKLNSIIKDAQLNLEDVLLIRHAKSDKEFMKFFQEDKILEYTQIQGLNMPTSQKYWMVFISDSGTSAKYYACYMIKGYKQNGEQLIFKLEDVDLFSDLKNRLIIDWGKSARMWKQYASNNNKDVLCIQENPKYQFSGYENVVLMYNELLEIIRDKNRYENWHTALGSVNAIYLITDTDNGKQYVGSAYGNGGLLSRWNCYIDTIHGGNKKMIDIIDLEPERYKYFQFSILQIIPKTVTADDVINFESLYKRKFQSIKFGMNAN